MATIDLRALFESAKTAGYEALPIGDYQVEIVSADATTSSNGKPMIKVKMKVLTGPHATRQIFNQFVLSIDNPNALAMFFKQLKAFGLNEQYVVSLGSISDLSPLAQALLGRQATVTLGHREWQGEMRNEVKGIKPLQGVAGTVGVPGGGTLPGSQPLPGGPVGGLSGTPLPLGGSQSQPQSPSVVQGAVPAPAVPGPGPSLPATPVAAPAVAASSPQPTPPPITHTVVEPVEPTAPSFTPDAVSDVPPPPPTPF